MTSLITGGKLWWADEESGQLGTVTKRDGRNVVILRNKTSGVVHMKVYDREGQKGELATHKHGQTQRKTHTLTVCLLLAVLNIQEEAHAKQTTEDAHSSVSPLLRTPVAAPALLATTCELIACPVKVSFSNTCCKVLANLPFSFP